MNGVHSTPFRRPGFLKRLFGAPDRENCVLEVRNLIASSPIRSISMLQIADILKRHDVGFSEVRPQFLTIYRTVLDHRAQCAELSKSDFSDLAHLETILELPYDDALRVRRDFSRVWSPAPTLSETGALALTKRNSSTS